ncbi:MAG: hypothetical protein FWD38_08655 [Oscillospiraceae bacterium]|nr:hypothetical protein [Oscillospiraceae bacterium]
MTKRYRKRASKVAWGFFWLLLAGLILANYFGDFVQLGVWSYIVGAIATIVLFHCLATLSFASLPIPLAALYYIFRGPIGWPEVPFWTLVLVTILATIGLHILLPKRFNTARLVNINVNESKKYKRKYSKGGVNVQVGGDDVIVVDVGDGEVNEEYEGTKIEEGDDSNNPYISVSFGYASRYLHADSLESAELSCRFGGMEVYFDHVTLHPDGAVVNVNCSFGSMEIYVPSHWRVIDEINASLANAEISRRLQSNDESAPTLTITGSVSLGNLEIKRIKGD